MTEFKPDSFDFAAFERELSDLIAAELDHQAEQLRPHELRAVALDCHPWHSILDLAVLTDADDADKWEIGDWQLYPLTPEDDDAAPWTAAGSWARLAREYWESAVAGNSHERGEQAADRLFQSCARALESAGVRSTLAKFRLAEDFQLYVGNPDDPDETNYCSGR